MNLEYATGLVVSALILVYLVMRCSNRSGSMTGIGWFQIALFLAVVLAVTKPLGYMFRAEGDRQPCCVQARRTAALPPLRRGRVKEQTWAVYAFSLLAFSLLIAGDLRDPAVPAALPFNPQNLAGVEPALAFNTAASFTTNTNRQSGMPETTVSYFTQMAGLARHNLTSAAVGIAVALVLARDRPATADCWAKNPRQLLGRSDPVHGLRAFAHLLLLPFPRLPGRPAELRPLPGDQHAGRGEAGDRDGACGLAGSDQDAGDQWGRLLQYQQRAPVRKPDTLV
jgi:hypothetical protein